jgi:hypothetical protein
VNDEVDPPDVPRPAAATSQTIPATSSPPGSREVQKTLPESWETIQERLRAFIPNVGPVLAAIPVMVREFYIEDALGDSEPAKE